MKKFVFGTACAVILATGTVNAQNAYNYSGVTNLIKNTLKKAFVVAHANQTIDTGEMNLLTTKATKTTSFSYVNQNWKKLSSTKYEYNTDGYVTSVETEVEGRRAKTVNEYDDKLVGFVNKTTVYTWDNSLATWTNPIVTYSAELTRNSKGNVVQEIIYTYDSDSQSMKEVTEISFGYGKDGKMNSISTSMEVEDMTIPINISDIKWYKYDASRLFNALSLVGDNSEILNEKFNMIESATISMTMMDISIKGKIKGSYSDTETNINISIPFLSETLMAIDMRKVITDEYGSYETTINMETIGESASMAKITATCNEYGDCIKLVSTGFDYDSEESEVDGNQSITMDYEYYNTNNGGVLKKSVVTNVLNKYTGNFVPTTKTTYDEYTDYVSGVNGIYEVRNNAISSQINATYSMNGTFLDDNTDKLEKGVYIVKKQGKAVKVLK